MMQRNQNSEKESSTNKYKHIQRIAYKLYLNRRLMGKTGEEKSDWRTAQRIIRNPLRYILFTAHQPLIWLEKTLWEPLLIWGERQALLSFLGVISNISIFFAAVTYIGSEQQRRDSEILNAWQIITSAHNQSGNGGRRRALEFLNASPANQYTGYQGANWRRRLVPWPCTFPQITDEEDIFGICFTFPKESFSELNFSGANLAHIELSNADLFGTNLSNTNLNFAVFSKANLSRANLSRANLNFAIFNNALLNSANLKNTNLNSTDFSNALLFDADLTDANLTDADLTDANFISASLNRADLSNAILTRTNLSFAEVGDIKLSASILLSTDLQDSQNLTTSTFTGDAHPFLCNVSLPSHIRDTGIDPNRDCKKILELLKDRYGISLKKAQQIVDESY